MSASRPFPARGGTDDTEQARWRVRRCPLLTGILERLNAGSQRTPARLTGPPRLAGAAPTPGAPTPGVPTPGAPTPGANPTPGAPAPTPGATPTPGAPAVPAEQPTGTPGRVQ